MSRDLRDSTSARKRPAAAGRPRRGRFHSAHGWASGKTPPGADPQENAVLKALAAHGDRSGLNCYPSIGTLATEAKVSRRTVFRCLESLAGRRVIAPDTSPPPQRYLDIRKDKRPTRWAVLMPHSAWDPRALELVNAELAAQGCEVITPETRPDLAPPSPRRKKRKDEGRSAPQRARVSVRVRRALEPVAEGLGVTLAAVVVALGAASPEAVPDVLGTTPEDLPAVLPAVLPGALAAHDIPMTAEAAAVLGQAPAAPAAVVDEVPPARQAAPVLPAPGAAELAAAAFALAFGAHHAPAADVEEIPPARGVDQLAAEVDETANPQLITTGRGVSKTQDGVSTRHERGVSETHNQLSQPTGVLDDQLRCAPAAGGQPQVVRGERSPAAAGAGSKRSRGQATPKRPRKRPVFDISRESVEVYRSAIPAQIKKHIPDHAVGRILRAITLELDHQGARLGHDATDYVAEVVAERCEGWRWRMVDAHDPVAVVIGCIVRGDRIGPEARPWCGRCEGSHPARRWLTLDDGSARRCPDCHPAVAPPLEDEPAAEAPPTMAAAPDAGEPRSGGNT